MLKFLILAVVAVAVAESHEGPCPEVKPVENFNLTAYQGVWYEISKLPIASEGRGACSQAEYTVDGDIVKVKNSHVLDGELKFIEGTARFADDANNAAKFVVSFKFGDFVSQSPLLILNTDFNSYSVAYNCKYDEKTNSHKEQAWILSRTKTLEGEAKTTVDNFLKANPFLTCQILVKIFGATQNKLGQNSLYKGYNTTFKVARKDARYQIWDVHCSKEGQKMFLKTLDSKGAIIINKEHQYMMEVLVEGTRIMQMAKLFRGRDIPFDVIMSDASACVGTRRFRSPLVTRLKCSLNRTLDWRDFYPLHVVYSFLNDLEKEFPSTCTVSVIGRTVEGRDIKMLKISNSDANNTGIWLDGATHAREWISTAVVTYIADYLAKNFDTLSVNYTSKDWYFVPVLNPDGYQHTHTVDRMWRKNRAPSGNAVTGVDLNRNFGYYWGRGGTEHSSGDPNHLNYRGPEPFSEPETTAIKDIILYSGTPFKIFLSFHACSEAISFPWCHTADPCPDYVNLLEGGTAMAKAIFETTGRMYKVGNFKDIMYYASGTSIDWSYGTARIPFSYLVELRSKQDRFLLPREEIIVCCKEILNGVKALVEFSDKKKCLNCSVIPKKLRT